MADIVSLRRQHSHLRDLSAIQTMVSLVARQQLLLERRNERFALASETMQHEAHNSAIDRWDSARTEPGFDPVLAAASSAIVAQRYLDWKNAEGVTAAAVLRRDAASDALKRQLQREEVADLSREAHRRRLHAAVADRDNLAVEDVIAHREWERRRS